MADNLTPAFQQLSETNRGPLVVVATFIFFAVSSLAVCTKLWTRLAATGRLAWTDWSIIVSLLCFLGQSIGLSIAVNNGVGRHSSDLTTAETNAAGKALFASNILLAVILGAAKASVSILILSVQPFPSAAKNACKIFLGVIAAWVIASIFAVAFQCDLPDSWNILAADAPRTCAHQHGIKIGLGAINIMTDIAIVVLAFFMIKSVQISLRRKCVIVTLFALRLATPPFAVLALVTSSAYYSADIQDRTWRIVPPIIWTQVMLGVSVITACIPSMKRFFDIVNAGVSNVPVSTIEQYEMSQSHSRSGSVVTLGKKFRARFGSAASKSKSRIHSERAASFSQSGSRYSVRIEGGARETDSVKRLAGGSVEGIRQQTEYEVEFEDVERGVT